MIRDLSSRVRPSVPRVWPETIDHRRRCTLNMNEQAATGIAEVRARRLLAETCHIRCRIVRVAPDDAQRLQRWQSHLDPDDAVELFEDSETTSRSVRRGRSALNDALKNRVRRLRETRLT